MPFVLLLLLLPLTSLPAQPAAAGMYRHDSVAVYDYSRGPRGFHLFEPAAPRPDSAATVLFLHGYGGINPMIYGGWIRHLVRQGYTVIYPRYQRNLLFPRPPRFAKNVSRALHMALDSLQAPGHVQPTGPPQLYIGHSYGGVIATHLAARADRFDLPGPQALLLAAPGSGPFKGCVLKDYGDLPEGLQLMMVTHENDWVVGDTLARRIHREAAHLPDLRWHHQQPIPCGSDTLSAHHNEAYSIDRAFDTGLRNYTAKKALRIGTTDALDRRLYWPLADQLLDPRSAWPPQWEISQSDCD